MELKQMLCLHKPSNTINEVVAEVGLHPTQCKSFRYNTICAKCGLPIDVSWRRHDINMIQPPVLDYPRVVNIAAVISPNAGNLTLPLLKYTEQLKY